MILFLQRKRVLDRLKKINNPYELVGSRGGRAMKPEKEEMEWIKGMKKRIEEEMSKKESDTILYWKGEMEKFLAKRPESLAAFQIELQNFLQRMQNRIKVLKNALQK